VSIVNFVFGTPVAGGLSVKVQLISNIFDVSKQISTETIEEFPDKLKKRKIVEKN